MITENVETLLLICSLMTMREALNIQNMLQTIETTQNYSFFD